MIEYILSGWEWFIFSGIVPAAVLGGIFLLFCCEMARLRFNCIWYYDPIDEMFSIKNIKKFYGME